LLDRWTLRLVRGPLEGGAELLKKRGIAPDQVSLVSFLIGITAVPFLASQAYFAALCCILLNRIGDGLDGALARRTKVSDSGAFLDIVLDFLFYSAVVVGFALADPGANSLAAAILIFSFVGTGSSFLAFAVMAERIGITSIAYSGKGFYYLGGLTEGTETIIFFVLFCILPGYFAILAYVFAFLCGLTTVIRVISGYYTIKTAGKL